MEVAKGMASSDIIIHDFGNVQKGVRPRNVYAIRFIGILPSPRLFANFTQTSYHQTTIARRVRGIGHMGVPTNHRFQILR